MAEFKMVRGVIGGDIDQCFQKLQQMAAEQNEVLGYQFNGKIITSDMTIDDAYSAVLGMTKTEYDKEMAEWRAQKEREELEFQERKPQLAMAYKEQGASLISPELIPDWNAFVDLSLNDLYKGADCKASLEILEAMKNGASLEEAKEIFDKQAHSGMSASRVSSVVEKFSGHSGARAYLLGEDMLQKPTVQQENEEKSLEEKAAEYKTRGAAIIDPERIDKWNALVDRSVNSWTKGLEIENALELMEAIERNADIDELKRIFTEQGHSGLSASMVGNIVEQNSKHGDGMYNFLIYNDPNGLDQFVNPPEHSEELSRADMAADLKARGNAIVNPATMQDEKNWDWYVDKCMRDIYEGFDAQCSLEIIEAMNRGAELDEIAQMFSDQNHSGMSAGIVSSAVEHFAPNGGGMRDFLFEGKTDNLEYHGGGGHDDQNGLDDQDIDTQEIGE